jgi:hypothetical protein
MRYIKEFKQNGELIALLVKKEFHENKMEKHATFVSSESQSLQLGVAYYPKNHLAPAHTHEHAVSEAKYEEVIHLIRGRMRVDLYTKDKVKFSSFNMRSGDTVHLVSGGHGFKMLSPCKCIEIKQGPYHGVLNKRNLF